MESHARGNGWSYRLCTYKVRIFAMFIMKYKPDVDLHVLQTSKFSYLVYIY